jgi:hypothetical protein
MIFCLGKAHKPLVKMVAIHGISLYITHGSAKYSVNLSLVDYTLGISIVLLAELAPSEPLNAWEVGPSCGFDV